MPFLHVWMCAKLLQSCLTLCNSMDCSLLLCPWDSPGKNTGVGCPYPPPQDLPNPGIKPMSRMLLNCKQVSTYWVTWEVLPPLVGGFFTTSTNWEVHMPFLLCFNFLKASQPLEFHLMVHYYFVINLQFIYSTWDIYYDRKKTFLSSPPFFSLESKLSHMDPNFKNIYD